LLLWVMIIFPIIIILFSTTLFALCLLHDDTNNSNKRIKR
jgi:hypothetical protein